MNNEPVAWMQSKTTEILDGCECMQSVSLFKANDNDTPLYTHPAKTLTDEEILDVWGILPMTSSPEADAIIYARAILKKASEK